MRYLLISIKDRAIDAFQPVASVRAEGEAIRSFQDAVNNPQNATIYAHPDDYDLYLVGYFDDNSGKLEQLEQPRQLALGKQVAIRN